MTDQKRPRVGEDEDNGSPDVMVIDAQATDDLSPLQSAIATGNDETIQSALSQLLDESKDERVLMERIPVLVSVKGEEDDDEEDDGEGVHDDEQETAEIVDATTTSAQARAVSMSLIVTSERCLFVAVNGPSEIKQNDNSQTVETSSDNFEIEAESIQLHAQSDEPISVYLQVEGADEEASPREITVIPNKPSEEENSKLCECLFEKITQLIEMHPLQGDDEGAAGMMGMMSGMMAMMAGQAETSVVNGGLGRSNNNNNNNSMLGPSTKEATPDERAAMLERLDNMLVVKPGLEIVSGQFSDAEEEEEEGNEGDVAVLDNQQTDPAQMSVQQRGTVATAMPKQPIGQFDDADDEDPLL